jgi:electron transport complex protein RnfG
VANQFRLVLVLALICAVAAGVLAMVDNYTAPRIAKQAEERLKASLTESLPGSVAFVADSSALDIIKREQIDGIDEVYRASAAGESFNGYVFTVNSNGYSSTIKLMVGVNVHGGLERVLVLSQAETPGLGTKVAEKDFIAQDKILNAESSQQLAVNKDGGDVQAIAGATISSRAAVRGINQALKAFELLSDRQ